MIQAEVNLEDEVRQRIVPLHIKCHESAQNCPVVIFSHGAGGSGSLYGYLATCWAEAGFICIQPTHADSIEWNLKNSDPKSFVKMMRDMPRDKDSWLNRIFDIKHVIDHLSTLGESVPELRGRIDELRVGVAGHSLGAFVSLVLAGAKMPFADEKTGDLRHPRIRCVLAISPQGVRDSENLRSLGFDGAESFSMLNLPAMFVTGEHDVTSWTTKNQRLQAFQYAPDGDKYLVSIDGANHMTFVGAASADAASKHYGRSLWDEQSVSDGDDDAHRQVVARATSLFLRAHLQQNHSALQELRRGSLSEIVGNKGQTLQK